MTALAHNTEWTAPGVPIVIENDAHFPFEPGERDRGWHAASDAELAAYEAYWEDKDDCPVCERVTRYDGEECTECGRLWGVDYSRADIEERQAEENAR